MVIPVLNDSEQAYKTVMKIDSQEASELVEVILVDDGSEDPIDFTLSEDSKMKFRILRLPKNMGRSAAINKGVEVSSGEFVSFLDVDCEPEAGYVKGVVASVNDGFELIFGDIKFFNEENFFEDFEKKIQEKRAQVSEQWELELTSACVTVKRDFYDQIEGFSLDFKKYGFEDRDFLIRLKEQFPNINITYDKSLIVNHTDSTTLETYLTKFYLSGRYNAEVFRLKHPTSYNLMNYSKIDINTAPVILQVLPTILIEFMITIISPIFKVIFKNFPLPFAIKSIIFKLLKGMAYLNGTIKSKTQRD